MELHGSGHLQQRVRALQGASGPAAVAESAFEAGSGALRLLDSFLGSGRLSAPMLRPVPATQGDDLAPGQIRLESDFRLGERDLHHFRLDPQNRSSGSSQFTAKGLETIKAEVERARPGARLVVIDLRQESHGLLHGEPVEWMGTHNQANRGKSPEAAAADEARRLFEAGAKSEAEVCAAAGVEYVRLPVTDHLTPDAATLQQFVALARKLEREGAWVHFHCKAGRGRTTTFMALWEMLRTKPEDLDATRVLERQRDLGGVDLLKTKLPILDGGSSRARRDFVLGFAEQVRRSLGWSTSSQTSAGPTTMAAPPSPQ